MKDGNQAVLHFYFPDASSLYVNQKKVAAFEGGNMTVRCNITSRNATNLEEEWCRLGSACVKTENGSINETPVEIDKSPSGGFSVRMRDLRTDSSGWYWCGDGVDQMPVHLTVFALTLTTTTPQTPGPTRISTDQPSSLPTEPPSSLSTVPGSGCGNLQQETMCSIDEITIIITAAVTVLVVAATFVGWKLISQKWTKAEVCETTVNQHTADSDVHYATIVHKPRATAQAQVKIPMEDVTYSTIVVTNKEEEQTRPADGSAIDMKD